MLLSVNLPGVEALRSQLAHATAARWVCGCRLLWSAGGSSASAALNHHDFACHRATTVERDDYRETFDLLLWVDDGWLSGVEIVDYVDQHGDESPDEIPPPVVWNKPHPRLALRTRLCIRARMFPERRPFPREVGRPCRSRSRRGFGISS